MLETLFWAVVAVVVGILGFSLILAAAISIAIARAAGDIQSGDVTLIDESEMEKIDD